jgi:hypothetical protein
MQSKYALSDGHGIPPSPFTSAGIAAAGRNMAATAPAFAGAIVPHERSTS